jgi:hypothetical protein
MNDRIGKLLKQAEERYPRHLAVAVPEVQLRQDALEKFAELIVRECAQFIFVLDAEPVSHKSAARMLQDHFGVK